MNPDKEQGVEPLNSPHTPDEWRAFFRERGWVITMDDRPGQAFDAFVHIADAARTASVAGLDADLRRIAEDANHTHNWNTHNPDHFDLHCGPCIADRALAGTHERPANHRPLADAARTASVAGLDRENLAAALMTVMNTDDAQNFVIAWGDPSDQTGTWDLALDMADAILTDLSHRAHRGFQQSRSIGAVPVPAVEGDPFQMGGSAPSIEQEPGEDLHTAATSVRDTLAAGHTPTVNQYDALNAALLREQEPGETLRAADLRRALRANRHAPDIARDPMANQWNRGIDRELEIVDRLALEADRNPQETERAVRLCRRRAGDGEECGLPYGHDEPHHPRARVFNPVQFDADLAAMEDDY